MKGVGVSGVWKPEMSDYIMSENQTLLITNISSVMQALCRFQSETCLTPIQKEKK